MRDKGNRDQMDMVTTVLSVACEASKKTHLMYKGKLGYSQVQVCLKELLKRDLLEITKSEKGRVLYRTTSKGNNFVRGYRTLKKLIS